MLSVIYSAYLMKNLLNLLSKKINDHIIQPIIKSPSPPKEVAMGTGIGMFVGFTPTVGAQMYIVFMIWIFSRYILRAKFDVIVGTALVWISNPLTMFPMYYLFLITGLQSFSLFGVNWKEVSYSVFTSELNGIIQNPAFNTWDVIVQSSQYLLIDLGLPMVLGSLFYAVPFSILSYIIVYRVLTKRQLAKNS